MQLRRVFSLSPARTGLTVLLLVGSLLVILVYQAAAAPPAQSPGDGETIFGQKCAACHTIGGGKLVGPDLKGVTTLRDTDWLTRWISAPDKMLAEGDPIATDLLQEYNNVPMPNLGLSDPEVAALIAYFEAQDGTSAAPSPPQPAEAQPAANAQPAQSGAASAFADGNADFGYQLFVGEVPLANGGPACISCHSVNTIQGLGGGTLGPNLTQVYGRYGDAGLAATLTSLPFPTMQGVFGDHPLTEAEASHLYAFFIQADQSTTQPVKSGNFVWLGLGGFVLLLALSQLIWMKRLNGVRKPLVGS